MADEKPMEMNEVLDKIESISGNAAELMNAIKTRAELSGEWVMTPEQAFQLVSTAAASTTIELVSKYLKEAPAPSKIEKVENKIVT